MVDRDPTAEFVRTLVAQIVREELSSLRGPDTTPEGPPDRPPEGPPVPSMPARSETVRITNDADLRQFVHHLLALFGNPKAREDIRAGRRVFVLAGGTAAPAAPGLVRRVERGAVTERHVEAAAKAGERLVLGRKAVLTPLAIEKARARGVPIDKERP